MSELELRSYNIKYFKEIPRSTIADYDYGGMRYPSGYNNHIEIYDKFITVSPIMSIVVPDDVICSIKQAICETCDNIHIDNNDAGATSYHHITIQVPQDINLNRSLFITVTKLNEDDMILDGDIMISFVFQNTLLLTESLSIVLNQYEAESIYDMLNDPFDTALV